MDKEVTIGDVKITFKRLNLKEWTVLEENKVVMQEAVKRKDFHGIFDTVSSCISTASNAKVEWENKSWFEMLQAYGEAISINSPTKPFPILTSTHDAKEEKLPWEYSGRIWYFWVNLFGNRYGWTKEQIEILDIDDAIGLYQETLIDDQLEKEWEWVGYGEVAFQYDTSTKKSNFKPLERPQWMVGIAEKPKMVKILKTMLPMGNVVEMKNDKRT
jgi:hypothetical protein